MLMTIPQCIILELAYEILTESFWKFQEIFQCGNVVHMPYSIFHDAMVDHLWHDNKLMSLVSHQKFILCVKSYPSNQYERITLRLLI